VFDDAILQVEGYRMNLGKKGIQPAANLPRAFFVLFVVVVVFFLFFFIFIVKYLIDKY